jgi:D-sedoheptulose 7-phosphate isomerase
VQKNTLSKIRVEERLLTSLDDAVLCIQQLKEEKNVRFIQNVADLLVKTFTTGNKVLIAGNGGSLCDAAHFAEELTGFFRTKRRPLAALALTEPGHITCTANDLGFEYVFSRLVEALGQPGDVFVGLTTSGNSANIIRAFESAKRLGLSTVSFLGKDGGILRSVADFEMCISGFKTSDRIQEAHMTAIHTIIELVELELFEQS